MDSKTLRSKYLDFFASNGHPIKASAPLLPKNDPTMLFNSAGMVPFKAYFLGSKKDLSRAASSQKCFRTTDIDRVGHTIRHMTFFEMLGNFSFGDYFKKEAIGWAWEFLTEELKLDPKRLHVTIFSDDSEAEELWKKHPIKNPIVRLGEDDNFWTMGPTGPCGPCSEIYFDRGLNFGCGKSDCAPGCDCDRFMEIWNLVFTQFDRREDGSLDELPRKNIDTGMGLERLMFVASGANSPFETDLFAPIISKAADLLSIDPARDPDTRLAFRVIGDHSRGATFLASEGVVPSNEGRGYVLRRLIRRAVRYGRLHGAKEGFVHKLVEPAMSIYDGVYPELRRDVEHVVDTLRLEEQRFLETLETGEALLEDLLTKHRRALPGDEAFKLYDTFGFPVELTREICAKRGVKVDEKGFEEARKRAQEVARSLSKTSQEFEKHFFEELQEKIGQETAFQGYEQTTLQSKVTGILVRKLKAQGADYSASDVMKEGEQGYLILAETPFYAEGGGQVGDIGKLLKGKTGRHVLADVLDTQKPVTGMFAHLVKAQDKIKVGDTVTAEVDKHARQATKNHHTATHLLNEALKRILGTHIRQAGSYVGPDKLRFDYTHPKALTPDQKLKIEEMVNEQIEKKLPVAPQVQDVDMVEKLGATTLVGEDYGEKPRFLLIGPKGWKSPMDRYSLELCGGTHVDNTGEIGHFKIVKDSSVSAGTRRIEAVAGAAVSQHYRSVAEDLKDKGRQELQREKTLLREVRLLAEKAPDKADPAKFRDPLMPAEVELESPAPNASVEDWESHLQELQDRIDQTLERQSAIKTEISRLKNILVSDGGLDKEREETDLPGGIKLIQQNFTDFDTGSMRKLSDKWSAESEGSVILLTNTKDDKLSFILRLTKDLPEKGIDAAALAKELAKNLGGSAGGRKDFAQGGGNPVKDWGPVREALGKTLRS